ncbi:hypothetical protein KVP09_08855 [Alcaligenaceae bacterium CGII-47]|nr:hypothetical protein [Alcaligenaceae bacterium CGII-47]
MTPPLKFTDTETDLLARTADALSAYLGKPVLAEVIDDQEAGFEWALFAIPLIPDEPLEDRQRVQVGGPGARFLGNLGGLTPDPSEPLECELLWAIQLSALEGARYIKVDSDGEEAAWADTLADVLPFALTRPSSEDDASSYEDEDEDDEDDLLPTRH